jgi:hypothetical protein
VRCLFYLALTVAGLSAPSTTLPYLLQHPFFECLHRLSPITLTISVSLAAKISPQIGPHWPTNGIPRRRRMQFDDGCFAFLAINQCAIFAFHVRRKQFVRGCLSVLCHCISWSFAALANVVISWATSFLEVTSAPFGTSVRCVIRRHRQTNRNRETLSGPFRVRGKSQWRKLRIGVGS